MPSIRARLNALLESDDWLMEKLAPGQIYFNRVGDKIEYPLLLVHELKDYSEQLLDGSPMSLSELECQADVYAKDLDDAQAIADHLANSLPGAARIVTVRGADASIESIFNFEIVNRAMFEPELKVWRCIMEFSTRYRRAAA